MNTGRPAPSAAISEPAGTFISNTMMVMMMAITPSVNASSRCLLTVSLYVRLKISNDGGYHRCLTSERKALRLRGGCPTRRFHAWGFSVLTIIADDIAVKNCYCSRKFGCSPEIPAQDAWGGISMTKHD